MLPAASSQPNTFPGNRRAEKEQAPRLRWLQLTHAANLPGGVHCSAPTRGTEKGWKKKERKGKSDQRAEAQRETPHGHQPGAGGGTGPGFRAVRSRESLSLPPATDASFPGSKAAMVFLFPQDRERSRCCCVFQSPGGNGRLPLLFFFSFLFLSHRNKTATRKAVGREIKEKPGAFPRDAR